MLDTDEQLTLLQCARRSIARGINGRYADLPGSEWSRGLLVPRATFTTLRLEGELRGCCGTIEPRHPLINSVWHGAWSSAYADPRFQPVSAQELAHLEIAISVLTVLEPIAAASAAELIQSLRPGIDGLVLRYGARQATFLPAVWESLADAADFVNALKRKAGWPDSYHPPGMQAFRYQTETFSSAGTDALAA